MKMLSYVESIEELKQLKARGFNEVIIASQALSRVGRVADNDIEPLARAAKDYGLKVFLELDILLTEGQFDAYVCRFSQLKLELFDALRVQDLGVAQYCFEQTNQTLHLITETGNVSLACLKAWEDYFGPRLSRLVLSQQVTQKHLANLKKVLTSELEYLVWGRILLFYTPRKLLSALDDIKRVENEVIEVLGSSEESPHKGFPITENQHGTFMFHIKELFLLEKISELACDVMRFDFRFNGKMMDFDLEQASQKDFKRLHAPDSFRGYFQINKSDVLFKKLKNQHLLRDDENYIGEIIESKKDEYMAISVKKRQLRQGDTVVFKNPDGKEKEWQVEKLSDLFGEQKSHLNQGEMGLIKYCRGIWVKSQIYQKKTQGESTLAQ